MALDMRAEARRYYTEVACLARQEIAIQQKRLALLKQDPDRWGTEIAELESAIAVTERHLFAAEKSRISLEYFATAVLGESPAKRVTAFYKWERHFRLDYERIRRRKASVITNPATNERGGPYVNAVFKYLSHYAAEEGIEWPLSYSAVAERVRRSLGRKPLTKRK